MIDVTRTFEWLVNGVPGAKTPMDVIARMCPELVQAGVALDRFEAFVRTLHPHIAGRSFLWTPSSSSVQVIERSYAYLTSAEFEKSAVARVFRTGEMAAHALNATNAQLLPHPELAALAREGYTSFATAPMQFIGGTTHAVTFATRRAGGFGADERDAIMRIVPPLARVGEIFALMRTAANLLNTYVGHDAGEKILSGRIQRGDTDAIDAVIWFSDLRGFTTLSSALAPRDVIAVLNDIFDCQVPFIEKHGGQVLKFMGDGMLAIFPVAPREAAGQSAGAIPGAGGHGFADAGRAGAGGGVDRAGACVRALAAAQESFAALDALNARRTSPVRFGVALHIGEIAYGNIGGAGRLDFTCIGAAVNLAARLETLTGKLGKNVVVSEQVAQQLPAAARSSLEDLGEFELKGVPGKPHAFAPTPA